MCSSMCAPQDVAEARNMILQGPSTLYQPTNLRQQLERSLDVRRGPQCGHGHGQGCG